MNLDLKIYNDISPLLEEKWRQLYSDAGRVYNTSYEWCSTWLKYFGDKKELFIIAGWKEGELQLLAPLYKKNGRLHAIGSDPDFYDKFCILCRNRDYSFEFANFLIEQKLELNLKLIYPDCKFFRFLMRRLDQEFSYKPHIHTYLVKPLIYKNEELMNSLSRKYKKLKRKEKLAQRDFNDELAYDFTTEKKEEYIDEFISFHQRKWDTFKSDKAKSFIKDLYLNNDFVVLSRLYLKESDKSVAYSLKYVSPDQILYNNLFSYNDDYAAMSPGLLVPYYDLISEQTSEFDYIDYGTGSYEYKYYFANREEIVLNVRAELCWKQHKNLYFSLKNIKNRLMFTNSRYSKSN